MRVMLAAIAAIAAVLLTSGPAAHAATVVFIPAEGGKYTASGARVSLVGDGADDEITAAIGPAGIDLGDATAPLAVAGPGSACAAVDEHRVHCAIDQGSGSLTLDGGDGADRLTIVRALGWTATGTAVSGGAGDDVLTGSDAADWLEGGPGRDVLRGMGGDDTLSAGDTGVQDGEAYDGGDGLDRLEVKGLGVVADLAAGAVADLATGAVATVAGVEGLTVSGGSTAFGTEGPDILAGGGTLDGRGGDDQVLRWGQDPQVLRGGAGDDHITYGSYDDVDGGPGDDVLLALQEEEAPAHAIRCGPGEDEVLPSTSDVAGPDCEQVDGQFLAFDNDLRTVGHGAALRLSAAPQRSGCGVVAWADAPGVRRPVTAVVHRRTLVRVAASVTVTLPLQPGGRRLIAAGRLHAPRVFLRIARRCPAHGRWSLVEAVGHRFGRRLAIGVTP